MKKYFIKTYGCQMNVADSAKLKAVLESAGYQEIRGSGSGDQGSGYQEADLILVNTCVVRQHAEDRAAWFITSLKGQKKLNPNLKIGLCGCLVAEPGRDIKKQFPHVDFFIPPNGSDTLAEYLHSSFVIRHSAFSEKNRTGLVLIMHGCDNFCSYCIVPYVRGREKSRPIDEVLDEIKGLIEQGVTEITLLGQNVNSYQYGLADLLMRISEDQGIRKWVSGDQDTCLPAGTVRISFLTSHPKDMSDEIIEAVAELPYVVKDFVMPLQSGDDVILEKMHRGYTLEHYKGRVAKIRSLIPQARISTDILVGFPGETGEQFQNTLRAIEEIKFNDVHMFAYSGRPGTAAASLPDQLPDAVKQARLQKLIQVVRNILK